MRKIISNFIIILIGIICMTGYSYAAGLQLQATIEIKPDVVEVSAGDKVTFTFVTKNIVNAEDYGKIYAMGGKIVYDTTFFELDGTNGILVGDTGEFNSTNVVTEGGKNGTITLKVKENATGSGIVEFSELVAGDGRLEDMETLGSAITPDQKFTITIKAAVEDEGENQNPPAGDEGDNQNPPAGDEGDNQNPPAGDEGEDKNPPLEDKEDNKNPSTDSKEEQQKEEDKTVVKEEIPKAGLNKIIVLQIVAILIIVCVMYRKNQKYKDIK